MNGLALRQDSNVYVERYLRDFVAPTLEEGAVRRILEDELKGKGKRVRPRLLMLCGQLGPAYKEKKRSFEELGALVELVHMASLIHDDIVDDSMLRRGLPTIQSRYGKDMAVYAGDLILGRVLTTLFKKGYVQAGIILGQTIEDMCRGEIGQFQCRYQTEVNESQYFKNIYGKTAALFQAACRIGALEGGADEKISDLAGELGKNLGYLFQIRDDVLDFISDAAKEGKNIHEDFAEGIITLPVLYAMEDMDYREDLIRLVKLTKRGVFGEKQISELDKLVEITGGMKKARDKMDYYEKEIRRIASEAGCPDFEKAICKILQMLKL